ncbi:MAG: hypothetical protein QXK26_03345 [Candidatus Bathyarchaeia archaeon]
MQNKINSKLVMLLLTSILVGLLIPLSVFYICTTSSKSEVASGEGNTTIIRIYRGYMFVEPVQPAQIGASNGYFLDVEHRLYPQSITVQPHSKVTLGIDYTCNILGQGDWNVQPSEDVRLEVEVPRMPSNCSIESFLDTLSDTGNREFYVVIEFNNPNNAEWNVGRPLVKVLNMFLGQPSEGAGMPEVEVVIETTINV